LLTPVTIVLKIFVVVPESLCIEIGANGDRHVDTVHGTSVKSTTAPAGETRKRMMTSVATLSRHLNR
jgi:hypothetical protein